MAERTPGPYRVVEGEIVAPDDVHIVCFGHDYDDFGSIGARWPQGATGRALSSKRAEVQYSAEVQANTEFIATACNAHDDLVALAELMVTKWGDDDARELLASL